MKRVKMFWAKCPLTDEYGWRLNGFHDECFSIKDGRTLAHDVLEHDGDWSPRGELRALGALWVVRGQWGDLESRMYSPEQMVRHDIADIRESGDWHGPVPRTKPLHDWEDDITALLLDETNDRFRSIARSCIRQGMRRILTQVDSVNRFASNNFFHAIQDAYRPGDGYPATLHYGYNNDGETVAWIAD